MGPFALVAAAPPWFDETMSDKIPATGFIVGTAFLFAVAFGAVAIMGLGMLAVLLDSDNPFAPLVQGAGVAALIAAALTWVLVSIRQGLRRDNRLRLAPILIGAVSALVGFAVFYALFALLFDTAEAFTTLVGLANLLRAPATWLVTCAAMLASLSYVATLRWQARNAQTKQFAPPED